ncbi:unnamed protein product [Adineta steineri]|uniref:Uncharacterized protein n=1 Tax=Adineta steineri TaxID=433720 RepID=A0A815AQF6_9BILA|nr:unnamed protein product [Adineta steineri]CAF1257610.1 unnamed protein product [Adineta steineri]CAF3502701.1 unnamed protein product [Adineta steineri]CAF3939681.1 unnamed protein product [Adineta steineri]
MNTIEEHSSSFYPQSSVHVDSEIDENDLKSKSFDNPDWTIQRETSITIDKTINDFPKCFSRKIQILIGIIIFIGIILLIIIPLMILTIKSH